MPFWQASYRPACCPWYPPTCSTWGGQQGSPIRNAVFFVLGFSAIFFLLGLPFTLLGGVPFEYHDLLSRIGGGVLILLGLYMLGLKPRFCERRGG